MAGEYRRCISGTSSVMVHVLAPTSWAIDVAASHIELTRSRFSVQSWVLYALCSVLPDSNCWPFARADERWRLTAAAARCLRLALRAAYAHGRHRRSAKDLGAALLRMLGHDGAVSGYLLPALPPTAGTLVHHDAGELRFWVQTRFTDPAIVVRRPCICSAPCNLSPGLHLAGSGMARQCAQYRLHARHMQTAAQNMLAQMRFRRSARAALLRTWRRLPRALHWSSCARCHCCWARQRGCPRTCTSAQPSSRFVGMKR